jgi:hypothetical protein
MSAAVPDTFGKLCLYAKKLIGQYKKMCVVDTLIKFAHALVSQISARKWEAFVK